MTLRWFPSVLLIAAITHPALAQKELTVIAPAGVRAAFEQLLPGFEQKGYRVNATYGSGPGTRQQIARGEPCDVAIVQQPYDDVLASGNVVVNTATPLARIGLGMAVREGAPKPSLGTAEAVKRTLLAAKSVVCADPKASAAGAACDEALQKLGITAQLEPKLKRAPNGAGAMQMIANGEAELGLNFVSEITAPGIASAGFLPADVSAPLSLVGLVSSHAKDPAGAKSLLQYLSSPEAENTYKAKGMMAGR